MSTTKRKNIMTELFTFEEKVETTETETVSQDKLTGPQVTVVCEKIRNSDDYASGLLLAMEVTGDVTKSQAIRLSTALKKLQERLEKESATKAKNEEKLTAWNERKKQVTRFHVKFGTPQEYSEEFLNRMTPEQVLSSKLV